MSPVENSQSYFNTSQQAYSTPDVKGHTDQTSNLCTKQPLMFNKQRLSERLAKSPSSIKPQQLQPNTGNGTRVGKSRPRREDRPRRHGLGMHLSDDSTFPATPDLSERENTAHSQNRLFPSFQDSYTPQSGTSHSDTFDEIDSQQSAASEGLFPSAVATPPIADSDLEPFEAVNAALAQVAVQRPTLNTAAAQNASLPSPGLSPTYHGNEYDDGFEVEDHDDSSSGLQLADSQDTFDSCESSLSPPVDEPSVSVTSSMLRTFEAMPSEMQAFMMFHFLRRCSKKTLHVIADVVNPALKCDFIGQLPLELSFIILSYLDHRDLTRAAQVSKQWRNTIDSNERGWKELFDRDGYVLPLGELDKAIKQGWGWQNPYGPDGYEADLSIPDSTLSSESDLAVQVSRKVEVEITRKHLRSSVKRKRILSLPSSSDRAKRRAFDIEAVEKAQESNSIKFSKSEGPLAAANAAALAVPTPDNVGLPSLRKLHLFKSLYRRHSLLQRSWTSGKVEPRHFAFPAHPSHVITCLQFDDDKILTGSDDTLIHVYDTRTGKLRKKLEGHEGGVWALQYEGNVLVSGSTDRSVRVWDIEKGLCTQVFHGHTSTVRCLQILMPEATGRVENGKPVMLPEKPLIITGSRDSQLRVWRLPEQGAKRYIQTGPPANDADCPYFVRALQGHSHSVRAIAANHDTLVSGSYDNTVRVWKISTGETLHRLQGHSAKVYSVVLDTKRNRCISGSMDNFVKIWSLESGQCLFTLEGHTSLVGLLDLRDERLVSAAADSTLRIWDPENGQCKSTLTAHTGAITCFQHDGQKVISGSDRTLKMWNVKTGECIKDLLTDLSGVWQVKFDERRCVAAVQRDNRTYVEVSFNYSLSETLVLILHRSSISVLLETAFHDQSVDIEISYS